MSVPNPTLFTPGTFNADSSTITLRDLFALSAMNGLVLGAPVTQKLRPQKIAEEAYAVADALLAERAKR